MFETLLKNEVSRIFDVLGQTDGLAPTATYLEAAYSTYSTAARSYVSGYCEHTNVPMFFSRPTADEIDGSGVTKSSVKILIAHEKLAATPKLTDKVRKEDGTVLNLTKIMGVPGGSVYALFGIETQE